MSTHPVTTDQNKNKTPAAVVGRLRQWAADIRRDHVMREVFSIHLAAMDDAVEIIEALDSSLTARDELLRNIHLSEDGEWLYSTWAERDWINQRDAILAKGETKRRQHRCPHGVSELNHCERCD